MGLLPRNSLKLSSSHSLESSVCPRGDGSKRERLKPHFPLAGRLKPTGEETPKHLLPARPDPAWSSAVIAC